MNRLLKTVFFILPLALLYACGGGGKDNPSTPYTPPANVAVSSVSISTTSAELEIGKTLQLTATISPSNATDKSVSWTTSSATVATVTPTGMVTAKAEGTTNITATCGGKSAVCKVTVKKATIPVTSVELDNTDITIKVGESKTLKVTIKPDNATDKTITWASSKTDIVTVDTDGKVTAVKEGVASVTATCGGKTASCKVTVEKAVVEVTSITLSESSLSMAKGDSKTIIATVSPSNATNKTVTWISSNDNVAKVSNGTITAVGGGNATITANCGGKSATCTITVMVPVNSITLSSTSLELKKGSSYTITATVNPSDATDNTVTWTTSNNSVATISNGTITAVGCGRATITATCGNLSATCQVNVIIPVSRITLTPGTFSLTPGESKKIQITIEPPEAEENGITYSSANTNIVTFSNGVVKAFNVGETDITVTCGGLSCTGHITVTKPISSIVLSETSITMDFEDSRTITATVLPNDAVSPIIWTSSNYEVTGEITNGRFTAKDIGTAIITASCGGKTATCQVTVLPKIGLVLSHQGGNYPKYESSHDYGIGTSFIIGAIIQPSSAQYIPIKWELSNPDLVTITSYRTTSWKTQDIGGVTYHQSLWGSTKSLGTTTITATCLGKSVSAIMNVVYKPVTSIRLTNVKEYLEIEESAEFIALVNDDASANYNYANMEWTASNKDIITITPVNAVRAKITGKKPGTTIITASCDGISVSETLTVTISGITLNKTSLTLLRGSSESLIATITPSGSNDKTIKWSSSNNSVAKVENGTISAVGVGNATITATCDNKSASCSVTVTNVAGEIGDRPLEDF